VIGFVDLRIEPSQSHTNCDREHECVIRDARLIASPEATRLFEEADELTAMFSASLGTARSSQRKD